MKFVISHIESDFKRRLIILATFPFFFLWGFVYMLGQFYDYQLELSQSMINQWMPKK